MMPLPAIVLCAAALVLGTFATSPLDTDQRLLVVLGAIALAFAASTRSCRSPQIRALMLLALVAGVANGWVHEFWGLTLHEQRTARYDARVLDTSPQGDGSNRITLALDGGACVEALLHGDAPPIGARVVVRGRLEPFDDARNPGEPSERALEAERGLDARLDDAQMLAIGEIDRHDPRTWLALAHQWAHERLREQVGEPEASILAGELWGERSALPPDLRDEFQETGTVHVLVTAGLHLGAVAALALWLLSKLSLPRAWSCALTGAAVWGFVWWSGAQLPAERAATMISAALLARACGRAAFSWNVLAIAAIVIALVRPASVASASFALSFSSVGAIFALADPIERWIEARIALDDRVREGVVLTLATQLGTWPLTAAIFLQFAPYGLLANLAVVPCVALTMALGVAQLALGSVPLLGQSIANANDLVLSWMLGAVRTIGGLPCSTIPMTPAPDWCIACYDAAIVAAPLLWARGARTAVTVLLAGGAVLVIAPPRPIDTHLRVTVLDVGQADGIVIQTPAGHAILVDAGGRLERGPQSEGSVAEAVGERIVVPFLLRHGIHRLDAIVLSHPHGDHAGGLAPVLRKLAVGELLDGAQRYGGHAYQDALSVAHAEGVPVIVARAGLIWRTDDGVTMRFIGPSMPFIGGKNAINDNSVAFLLQYRGFRMLFTGDAGVDAEQRFLREGIDLHADVLKVGHHGSAYGSSPAFIAAVHPQYAIVSVGRHNLFGHPAPSTLDTLARFGARVFRTDNNGAVGLTTDGAVDLRVLPTLSDSASR